METGKRLTGGGGGCPLRVGGVVQNDLAMGARDLRLAGDIGVEHGVGQHLDKVGGHLAFGAVALDVLGEIVGGGDEGVETGALGGVFVGGERAAIAQDEAGDGAVASFDFVANLVTLMVDEVHAIAEVGTTVVERADLGGGGFGGPELGGSPVERRIRRGGEAAECGGRDSGEEGEAGTPGKQAMWAGGEMWFEPGEAMRVVRHTC